MAKDNLRDQNILVPLIRNELDQMFDHYLNMMNRHSTNQELGNDLLKLLGATQAILQDYYVRGIGEKDAAMFFYAIADRIVDRIVDREIEEQQEINIFKLTDNLRVTKKNNGKRPNKK